MSHNKKELDQITLNELWDVALTLRRELLPESSYSYENFCCYSYDFIDFLYSLYSYDFKRSIVYWNT